MRSRSPAQSCGHRGRWSTAAAVVADRATRHVAAAWPVPGRVHLVRWDERFSKRRVLLQYAYEVEHGWVLMWRGNYGNWKHYVKRLRVWEIPAHFARHTQTQAVCVWSKRRARISEGLRRLLDSRRWRRRRNYHSLMSPIGTAIRRRNC